MATPEELKKAIRAAGLEVYRAKGGVVHLAERVRENLIMDAGISLDGARFVCRMVVQAPGSQFPKDSEEQLFARAREAASAAKSAGFEEVDAKVEEVVDPGGSGRVIDRISQVVLEKGAEDVASLVALAAQALTFPRALEAQPA